MISKQHLCETSSPYVYVFAVCLLSFSVVAKDKNRFHRVNGNGKWDIQPAINYISNVTFKVILCKYCGELTLVKPGQNKKGQKNFQLHHFLNPSLQLTDSRNSEARIFFTFLFLRQLYYYMHIWHQGILEKRENYFFHFVTSDS